MKDKKTDLRIKMTKQLIRQALTTLLHNKRVQELTVKELCAVAEVNRSTFYTHYSDIYDLLHKIEEEIFCEFEQELSSVDFSAENNGMEAPLFMQNIFQFLSRNSDMCIVLLGKNSDRSFITKVIESSRAKSVVAYAKIYAASSERDIDLYFTFVASGFLGILEYWFAQGMKESPQEMAILATRLITHGISFLEQK